MKGILLKSRKVLAAAAILTLAAGASAAVTVPASAATTSCGTACTDFYSTSVGPEWILDSIGQGQSTGTPIIMDPASNTNPGEDFVVSDQGAVSDFFAAGLVSQVLDQHYPSLEGAEFEYAPNGAQTGQCVGVPSTPTTGTLVELEPCGVTAKTVWFFDPQASPAGSSVLINGGDTVFPADTLTYPSAQPGSQQLEVAPLQTSGGSAVPTQVWGALTGSALQGPSLPVSTATVVTSSGSPSVAGQTVTYTATLTPVPDGGSVSLTDGGTPISGCQNLPVAVSTGTATCQVTYDSPGSHPIVASYGGDTAYASSLAGTLTQTVNPPPPPPCTTTITGTHATQLAVTSGKTCLVNATQSGRVTVAAGAALSVTGSKVSGTVTATGAASVTYCGSTQSGTMDITGTTGAVTFGDGGSCAADAISGRITISGTAGPVDINGLEESGTLTLSGNAGGVTVNGISLSGPAYVQNNTGTAAVTVSGNTINGSLYCTGNTPAPADNGAVNTVAGTATGQCAAIARR